MIDKQGIAVNMIIIAGMNIMISVRVIVDVTIQWKNCAEGMRRSIAPSSTGQN
jgi:hypothetical protein